MTDSSSVTLSKELTAEFAKFGEDGFNRWKAEASPEQKEFGAADLKRFMEDPAHA